jgi:hypothetical protein
MGQNTMSRDLGVVKELHKLHAGYIDEPHAAPKQDHFASYPPVLASKFGHLMHRFREGFIFKRIPPANKHVTTFQGIDSQEACQE